MDMEDMSLKDFYTEDTFTHPKIQWGADVKETETALGFYLRTEPDGTGDRLLNLTDGHKSLFGEKKINFCGLRCYNGYQFNNGQLWSVSISCNKLSDGNKKFEEMLNDARNTYGKEEEITHRDTGDTYKWSATDADEITTNAMLSAQKTDGKITSINFTVNKFVK